MYLERAGPGAAVPLGNPQARNADLGAQALPERALGRRTRLRIQPTALKQAANRGAQFFLLAGQSHKCARIDWPRSDPPVSAPSTRALCIASLPQAGLRARTSVSHWLTSCSAV